MNIDMDDNTKDIELAKKVGSLFRLDDLEMKEMIQEVETSVARWREVAKAHVYHAGSSPFLFGANLTS